MTRLEAQHLFGSAENLRKFLGLETVQGVYMMPPNERIPAKHEITIRDWQLAQAKKAATPKRSRK